MPRATSNGIEIEYDAFGDPAHPALLLVMGLGAQMTAWRPEFCRALADRGLFVLRYDNRDSGLSTSLDDLPVPDVTALRPGDASSAPYLIADMARDAAGLLDALRIDAAHVVGASMGGMIAQQLAIDEPDRVRSLCSIMSTTGDRSVGQPCPPALPVLAELTRTPARGREEKVEHGLRALAAWGSPAFPLATEVARERLAADFDRAWRPGGYLRQYAAILASPDRTHRLRSVTVPTLVIHGESDQLVHRSGGEATAAAVPGADLLMISGMGHDLPEPLWPTIVDAITRNTAKTDSPPAYYVSSL